MRSLEWQFINQFYKGAKQAALGAKIIGGDITGADKIFISITALGDTRSKNISSRKNAKPGYIVITKGLHGASAKGLKDLQNNNIESVWIKNHLEPKLEVEFSKNIAQNVCKQYAMMDSSDGLADALFKIAEASNVKIIADINKIQENQELLLETISFRESKVTFLQEAAL